MPVAWLQRKASVPDPELPRPTLTEPSAEDAWARLWNGPPLRSPRPPRPVASIQRKASSPSATLLNPTAVSPSPETPVAKLKSSPPVRSPSPEKAGSAACAAS